MNGPIPTFSVVPDRLIGLEIEVDARGANLIAPDIDGFTKKRDQSLSNGFEYILEPAAKFDTASVAMSLFAGVAKANKMRAASSGGLHVHIQAQDISRTDAAALAGMYAHWQPAINRLLPESRHDNHFCEPFEAPETEAGALTRAFELDIPAATRAQAKSARKYKVINFAMLRCSTDTERSIEFRQAGVSTRADNVLGWAALCLAFVEVAKNDHELANSRVEPSFRNFLGLLSAIERRHNVTNLRTWAEWRERYLNAEPTQELLEVIKTRLAGRTVGIFTVAEVCDIHNGLAKRAMEMLVQQGIASPRELRYKLRRIVDTEAELTALLGAREEALANAASLAASLEANRVPAVGVAGEQPLDSVEEFSSGE